MSKLGSLTPNSKLHIREMLLTPQISESVYADVQRVKPINVQRSRMTETSISVKHPTNGLILCSDWTKKSHLNHL